MPEPTKSTQTRTAETLARLTAEDAPAVLWRLAPTGGGLDGQILTGPGITTDTDRRRALAAWQRVLGAGPVQVRESGPTEHLAVAGSYEGVPVAVTTIVDAARTCSSCGGAA